MSNREMCRDELLALLREASALKQSFGISNQPLPSPEGASNALPYLVSPSNFVWLLLPDLRLYFECKSSFLKMPVLSKHG